MKPYVKESDYLMPLEVAGLKYRNNFVVGSGPAVKTLDTQVLEPAENGHLILQISG